MTVDPEHYVDRGSYSYPVEDRAMDRVMDRAMDKVGNSGRSRDRDRGTRRHGGTGGLGRRTAGGRGRGVQRLVLLGTVLVLFLLGGAGTASAHAALKGSDPVDGSVLDAAPGTSPSASPSR